jgi:hypothetical protein
LGVSPSPIVDVSFYGPSQAPKKVIYPGGFIVKDSFIDLFFGKDDQEIWWGRMELNQLEATLQPVKR